MGSVSSEVDICNSALFKVGADSISSLDEDSERARICKTRYAMCRDELLGSHPWNFALARVELAQTINTPEFDYTYEYQLPSDLIRVIKTDTLDIPPSSDKRVTTTFGFDLPDWRIEGDKLLTNEGEIKIVYIKRETDVSKFSPMFAETLALRLAADFAYKLTNDLNLSREIRAAYTNQFALARSYDAQESANDTVSTNDWVNSRL